MNKGKVSIIVPSFNQGQYIEATLFSIFDQSYNDIEILVIDGGSSDETLQVLNKYADRIAYQVSEKDRGQSDAINKGIRYASGEFITWLNSDDLIDPLAIERSVDILNKCHDVDFVYGDVQLIDEQSTVIGQLYGEQVSSPSVFYNLDLPIPQQGSVWRKEVNCNVGLLDESWHYVLDREFFLRVCLSHNVYYINNFLGSFRQHENSKSVKMKSSWIMELPRMYEQMVANSAWKYSKDNVITKRTIASSYVHAAYLAAGALKPIEAARNFFYACYIYPMIPFNWHVYKKPINKLKKLFGV